MPPVRCSGGQVTVEKDVFKLIDCNDVAGLRSLLLQDRGLADLHDENGMTPLQHAAYKGSKDMVQMLLDQGADVNSGKHEHGYSALHFAALSGNVEVCQLLLNVGAKTHVTNSVGRTAAQMAAFVGNHKCVAVINNYLPRGEVEYYSVAQGLEKEPKLPPALTSPLHKLIMQVNVHPVRIALALLRAPMLFEHLDACQRVLALMSEREMKKGCDTNEVMAFKFHYLACVLAEIDKSRKVQEKRVGSNIAGEEQSELKAEDRKEERRLEAVESFARQMLRRGKGENTSPEHQERFIRECVREFPYRESTVFRQMVASLAQSDSPPAFTVVSTTINGQRGFSDAKTCYTCGEEGATKKCSKCKAVQYCDRECQRLHWFMHKKACTRLSQTDTSGAANLATEIRGLSL